MNSQRHEAELKQSGFLMLRLYACRSQKGDLREACDEVESWIVAHVGGVPRRRHLPIPWRAPQHEWNAFQGRRQLGFPCSRHRHAPNLDPNLRVMISISAALVV